MGTTVRTPPVGSFDLSARRVGLVIRLYVAAHDCSLEVLAKRLGYSRSHFSRLMHGHVPASEAIVEQLARELLFPDDVRAWLFVEDGYKLSRVIAPSLPLWVKLIAERAARAW